ncbi:MAG: protein YgfX [Thiolinea sp.]
MLLASSSAQPFEAELVLDLKSSNLLLSFMLITHSLVLAIVCLMSLAWFWKLALILLIGLLGIYEWRSQPSLGSKTFKSLIWRETGGWELETAQDQWQAAKLTQHFSTLFITILHLQIQGKTWVVILLPDNLNVHNGQILRRRLKLLA